MSSHEEMQSLYQHTNKSYTNEHDLPVCSESCVAIYEFEQVTHCMGTCTIGANDDDLDRDDDIAAILQVKCAVLTVAQQQLKRLMDDTNKIMIENRSWCELIRVLQRLPNNSRTFYCILLTVLLATFLFGLLLGAASCGTWLRRFNSPILTCINNMFIDETFDHNADIDKVYRSIV